MKNTLLLSLLCCLVCMATIADEHGEETTPDLTVDSFADLRLENLRATDEKVTLAEGQLEGHLVSPEIAIAAPFNACVLAFRGATSRCTSIEWQLRFREEGEWSEWQQATVGDFLTTADKSWRFLQYKAIMRSDFPDQSPELHQVFVTCQQLTAIQMQEMQAVDTANASFFAFNSVPKPAVISRSAWGARPPKNGYTSHTPKKLTIHHTYRPTAKDFSGSSTIRGIQAYHMDSNGWSDIGYHFVIGIYTSSGQVSLYQGRPETVVGAHAGGANTNNVGVCLVGDHTVESLHPKAYNKLIDTLAWLCYRYNISPNNIFGHRDFGSTTCPGGIAYAKLSQIKADVWKKVQGD